ncbi:NADH-ubiquinone oxidoreductase 29.9 kDa subunit, mitochondrial [Sordaria brevicollis]|uniref:NADH-ubiquinone oxidoreductase 29.9 kDa subunit, mitochondrial n=1 Tax=Sordaria brevicollis TaxID=83679 RepID=A0AAE0UC35_SORBR|nr:NADH-ubiquinone oxidoreductase 29.9 kDa subunit, mitochondrial [Sordaria brevicollis]
MRAALRLFASAATGTVRPSARFLKPGSPTGLTGLGTHPSPRSALLYLYNQTLDKLKQIPEHSLYRQSSEALTKHRLAIVEQYKPEGYDAWQARASKLLNEHLHDLTARQYDGQQARVAFGSDGRVYFIRQMITPKDWRDVEYDGAVQTPHTSWDGARYPSEVEITEEEIVELEESYKPETMDRFRELARRLAKEKGFTDDVAEKSPVEWEAEPQLTAEQVAEMEAKIGSGLIEEVIQVAEGELKLVDIMAKAKAWEALEEDAPEGQWTYFERKQ